MTNYRGLTDDEVREIGKVTIAGTALEETLYKIGEALDLEPRGWSGTTAAKEIRKRLSERGVPPWGQVTPAAFDPWLAKAINVLDRRGAVVHQTYMQIATEDGMVPHGRRANRKEDAKPVSVTRIEGVRKELDDLSVAGDELWLGLLANLAPGIYIHYFGPDAQVPIVKSVDGEWPPRPTPEQLDEWLLPFQERWPGWFPSLGDESVG